MLVRVTVVAMVAWLAVPAHGAAHDSGPVQGGHPHLEESDGCTGLVDEWLYYDTHHACLHHDSCWAAAREGRADAKFCDQDFYLDLHRGCNVRHGGFWRTASRWLCYSKALVMMGVVMAASL